MSEQDPYTNIGAEVDDITNFLAVWANNRKVQDEEFSVPARSPEAELEFEEIGGYLK